MFIAFEYLFNIRFSIENVTLHSNIGNRTLFVVSDNHHALQRKKSI
jgi:hypothetical protein